MVRKSREFIARALESVGERLTVKDWIAIGLAVSLGMVFLITGGAAAGFWPFQVALLVLAVFLLMYGSDWVIQGASVIGLIFGMTLFAIGVLFVSPGTTFPELFTNLTSVSAGVDNIDFAIGNAVGSYTFNTLGIVGCASMIVLWPFFSERIKIWLKNRRRLGHKRHSKEAEQIEGPAQVDVPPHAATKTWFAMGSIVLLVLLSWDGMLTWLDGLILIVFFGLWLWYVACDMRREQRGKPAEENEYRHLSKEQKGKKISGAIFVMIAGFVSLVFGAKFLVSSAASLAKMAGFTDTFIGLTIVAMGTSAPEFAVSVSAVAKKRYALGIGNIIGADILDILMVLGASAIVRTFISKAGVPFNTNALIDCAAAFVAMFLLWLSLAVLRPKYKLTWQKGLFLFLPYVVYVLYLLERDGSINLLKGLIGPL
ncbi:MAG: sodium:calcium antiporter [Candidatus Paceibacterota bacterium]